MTARDFWSRARATLRRVTAAIHVACGMPDYEAYAAHVRAHHPGAQPMSREAFFRERTAARYARGRSRCC